LTWVLTDQERAAVHAGSALARQGAGVEAVLRLFRDRGLTKTQSIKCAMAVLSVDLAQAKEIVHLSAAWRDRQADDDGFHDELFRQATGLADDLPKATDE
jgi:hypothetical protein